MLGQQIYGSNKHLARLLKPILYKTSHTNSQASSDGGEEKAEIVGARAEETEGQSLCVLLSTSLLARGLDFDPNVFHIFILDPHGTQWTSSIAQGVPHVQAGEERWSCSEGWWARCWEAP